MRYTHVKTTLKVVFSIHEHRRKQPTLSDTSAQLAQARPSAAAWSGNALRACRTDCGLIGFVALDGEFKECFPWKVKAFFVGSGLSSPMAVNNLAAAVGACFAFPDLWSTILRANMMTLEMLVLTCS